MISNYSVCEKCNGTGKLKGGSIAEIEKQPNGKTIEWRYPSDQVCHICEGKGFRPHRNDK